MIPVGKPRKHEKNNKPNILLLSQIFTNPQNVRISDNHDTIKEKKAIFFIINTLLNPFSKMFTDPFYLENILLKQIILNSRHLLYYDKELAKSLSY
jgi:hypothetical protein